MDATVRKDAGSCCKRAGEKSQTNHMKVSRLLELRARGGRGEGAGQIKRTPKDSPGTFHLTTPYNVLCSSVAKPPSSSHSLQLEDLSPVLIILTSGQLKWED